MYRSEYSRSQSLRLNAFLVSLAIHGYIHSLRRHVRSEDVEDAIAEALLRWCEQLEKGRLEKPDIPRSWLITTAVRVLDEQVLRWRRIRPLDELIHEPESDGHLVPRALDSKDIVALFEMARLSSDEIQIIRARELYDMPWEEIRLRFYFNCSQAMLRQRYHRAMKKLKNVAEGDTSEARTLIESKPQKIIRKNLRK